MSLVPSAIGRFFKAAGDAITGRMRFPRGGRWGIGIWHNVSLRIAQRVGDGSSNTIVMACRNWVERVWPEAPLIVLKLDKTSGEWKRDDAHPLLLKIRRPNPYYSGRLLMMATLVDRLLTGNGYWVKIRSSNGRVAELWWVPSWLIRPYWPAGDDTVFIESYLYSPGFGQPTYYAPSDIVHFRRGFDPRNIRLGRNDMPALLGEIYTDEAAAQMQAALGANLGVPGVVISPKEETDAKDEDLDAVKDRFVDRFSGDNTGAPLVMSGPTDVHVLSWSPKDLNMESWRRVPEERIPAVIGIPVIVTGLGAGLDRSIYNNVSEAREAAYESYIMPDHAAFDDDLTMQLLPDFDDEATTQITHDYSKVRVLQPDLDKQHARARGNWLAGLWTLNQALIATGEAPLPGPEGNIRAIPNIVTLTQPGTLALPAPTPAPTPTPTTPPAADSVPSLPPEQMSRTNGHTRKTDASRNAQNGKAATATITAADLGEPLAITANDLDALADVGIRDFPDAEKLWRDAAAGTGLEDLLQADPKE